MRPTRTIWRRFIRSIAVWWRHGRRVLARDQRDVRFTICKANAGGCYDAATKTCQHCQCYMPLKTFLAAPSIRCPRGLWPY